MKWYEEHYVNRRDWVLDHLEYLALTPAELEIVMLIDFSSQYQLPISMDSLSSKSGLTMDEVNDAVSSLVARRYLTIRASGGNVAFRLDGLFSTDTARRRTYWMRRCLRRLKASSGAPSPSRRWRKSANGAVPMTRS